MKGELAEVYAPQDTAEHPYVLECSAGGASPRFVRFPPSLSTYVGELLIPHMTEAG